MQYLTLIPCRTSLRSCYLVWYLAGYTFDFLVRYAVSYRAAAAWDCQKDRERFSAHFIIHSRLQMVNENPHECGCRRQKMRKRSQRFFPKDLGWAESVDMQKIADGE